MIEALKRLAATLHPKAEPLLWIGLIGAVADAINQNSTNGTVNWWGAAPVVGALVLRNFVTSPATRQSIEDDLKAAQQTVASLQGVAPQFVPPLGVDALNAFEQAWAPHDGEAFGAPRTGPA